MKTDDAARAKGASDTVEEHPRHNVANILDSRALEIDRFAWSPVGEWTPLAIVRRQISHTLDEIARVQGVHEHARLTLLKVECYVDTSIGFINAQAERQRYNRDSLAGYRVIQRDRLNDRLFRIDQERRDLALREERDLQVLRDRLLELLNRYWQLQG